MFTPTNDAPTTSQGRRLALVIGVNGSSYASLPVLQYCVDDANAIAEVLQIACNFELLEPPLVGEQATSERIKTAILDFAEERTDDDFLLLYFSGHGIPMEIEAARKDVYLVSSNFRERDVKRDENMHLSLRWLRDKLYIPTQAGKVVMILDCCYAGAIGRTTPDPYLEELQKRITYYFASPGAESGAHQNGLRLALTATGHNTTATEQDGRGIMTGSLLSALKGEVDSIIEKSKQGQITIPLLYEYLQEVMPSTQQPSVAGDFAARGRECVLTSYPERAEQLRRKPSPKLVAERPTTYIPFPRDPLFQERPGEFARLEQLLVPSSSPTQRQPVRVGLVGVIGMGGIGKTQLAVEFSYRYQQRFPSGIFWVPAMGRDVFEWQTEFAKLAFNTGYLPPDDDLSNAENESKRSRHLCRYLANHADALLILDNVEQPELVTSALPALAGGDVACNIVYTSRITTNTSSQVTLYEVERLLEDVALHLLLETARPEVHTDFVAKRESTEIIAAKQICECVGYLPLALVHLRGHLQQDKRTTLTRLAEVLNQGKLTRLKQVLFETFRLSWEHVRDEESRRLFQLACYFPEATPIPLWLLGLAAGLGEDAGSFEPLGEACLHLQEMSLFEEFEGEQVRLHPLVREFGQMLLAEEQDKAIGLTANAAKLLVSVFTNLNDLEQRTRSKGYWICLEEVRAARDYANVLANGQTTVLEQIERWLDRDSYLLAEETRVSELFYQQLYNHSVEEAHKLFVGKAPEQWLEQINQVGAEDQSLIRIFAGHTSVVTSVALSADGRYVLTSFDDNTIRLWECSSGQALHTFEGHTDGVNSVAFSPDGRYVLTGSDDRTARLWESSSGQALHTFQCKDWVRSVTFSVDGRYVLTGSDDRTARLWESSSGQALHTFKGHASAVMSVAFSPNGHFIVTCDYSGRVYLWIAQGLDTGRLFAMYKAVYEVGAVFWQDATHLVLADTGGSRGCPNIYRLRLHGLE